METGIEVNSLSLQSAEPKSPAKLVIPEAVTSEMLENSQKALEILDKNIPELEKGISLHAGSVIDIEQVQESDIPITSVDVPDLAYPKEFLKTVADRPTDILNHIAWRLNSTMGWSKEDAREKSNDMLDKVSSIESLSNNPFVRVSLEKNPYHLEKLLNRIPSEYKVAIEYNAETDFSVEEYLEYIKNLNKRNPNIGLSIDPAHLYEYYAINSSDPNAKESTMNALEHIFNDRQNKAVFTLDINNVSEDISEYGKTHQVFNKGALNLEHIVSSYKKYLNENNKEGRLAIEFSPKELSLFLDSSSNASLMSTIKQFS